MKFALKKKKKKLFLKPKQICINQKTSKGKKKKMKRKEMNKGTCTAKKNSYWEIWNSKLEKRYCRTSIGRKHKSYEQGGRQNVDVKV